MNRKAKRLMFEKLKGRPGISARILEIAKEIVLVDSYKRAIIGAGQIRVLAEIAEADTYWDEKMSNGMRYEERICQGCRKVVFDENGTAHERIEDDHAKES